MAEGFQEVPKEDRYLELIRAQREFELGLLSGFTARDIAELNREIARAEEGMSPKEIQKAREDVERELREEGGMPKESR